MAFRGFSKEWVVMSCFIKSSPAGLIGQVRNSAKLNLKNPRPLFYNRKRLMEFVNPKLPPPPEFCVTTTLKKTEKDPFKIIENNPYGVFLSKKLRRNFEKYPFIAIFHTNSFTGHDHLHARGAFFDNEIDITLDNLVNANVAKVALTGTKFDPALRVMQPRASLGFCPDPYPDLNKLFKVLKKIHHYVLIGAIYEGRLLNRGDLEMIAKFPDITAMRAQLCHTLSLPMIQIQSALTSQQTTLSQSLVTYSNPQTPPEIKEIKENEENMENDKK